MVLFGPHFEYFLARAYGARHRRDEKNSRLRRTRKFGVFRPKAAEKTGHFLTFRPNGHQKNSRPPHPSSRAGYGPGIRTFDLDYKF